MKTDVIARVFVARESPGRSRRGITSQRDKFRSFRYTTEKHVRSFVVLRRYNCFTASIYTLRPRAMHSRRENLRVARSLALTLFMPQSPRDRKGDIARRCTSEEKFVVSAIVSSLFCRLFDSFHVPILSFVNILRYTLRYTTSSLYEIHTTDVSRGKREKIGGGMTTKSV